MKDKKFAEQILAYTDNSFHHHPNTKIDNIQKILEAYANHRIKQLLDVSDEEIEKYAEQEISSWNQPYTIAPKTYMIKGAKWLRNHLLNKEI